MERYPKKLKHNLDGQIFFKKYKHNFKHNQGFYENWDFLPVARSPMFIDFIVVRLAGIEPATCGLGIRRSIP